jgi:DNA-binding GntR family transcriptional regulator
MGELIARVGQDHRPLRDVVADEIRQAILSGRFAQGQRLVEDRLAEELGVSRNPVREALRTLESEGFVRIAPRRGATVARLSPEEGREVLEVASALEAQAARLAVRRSSPELVGRLQQISEAAWSAIREGRTEDVPRLHSEFHGTLAQAAGNSHLARIIASLRDTIQWMYASKVQVRGPDSWREHEEIVRAMAEGDEEKAAQLAADHVANAIRTFVGDEQTDEPVAVKDVSAP